MIKIKHVMDAVEKDDGQRLWVEPIGLTKDLVEWCQVHHILTHLGPPKKIWKWFDEHPSGYEYFRGKYHEALQKSTHVPALQALAQAGQKENFTLVHSGDNEAENSATALYEFLTNLQAYSKPE
jgi:uncharacterized protein YeaO (DUF488 family)